MSKADDDHETDGRPEPPIFERLDVGKSRGRSYYKCDDENNPFKVDTYGTHLSEDPTLGLPFENEDELDNTTSERFEDFSALFQQGMEDFPEDWYSMFHEVMHGQRTKESNADAEDRQQQLTEKFKGDMTRFAFKLASTPPDMFGDIYSAKSNAIKQADISHPWLAANRLLGSLWRDLQISTTVEEDEEAANKLRAQLLKAAKENQNNADGNGGKLHPGANPDEEKKQDDDDKTSPKDQSEAEKKDDDDELGLNRNLDDEDDGTDPPKPPDAEEDTRLQEEVLDVVTAETDAQKEAGLSVAARTDYLLSSFENATGFMKRMNACELWSITKGVDLLDLMIPWSTEELKAWNYQDGLPPVPPLDRSKTDNPDTAKLKALRDIRDRTRCHVLPSMQIAASFTPRCTYPHFLKLLCDGRQMYSDFAHLYPLLNKEAIRLFLCREFEKVESTKIAKVWKIHNDKMFNRLRSAASRKKKQTADAEAKANAEETEKIEQQREALANELEALKAKNDQNKEEIGRTRSGRKRTTEEIELSKQIQELNTEKKKKRQCVLANNKEAKAAQEEAETAAKLFAEQEALEQQALAECTKKTKKKKKMGTFTLIDLTGIDDDVKAPARDQTKKNKTAYVPPLLPWLKEARHLSTLWFQLHFYLDECALREEVNINYEKEEDAERVRSERENATAACIEKAVNKLLNKKKKITPEVMKSLLRKYTSEDETSKEELMLNPFVRRAILRLGLVDVQEFCDEGALHPKLTSAKAKNIASSLQSWMPQVSERHILYRVLRIVEHLSKKKDTLASLKTLIKKDSFNCQEKDRIVKMVDVITKNNGVEKKKFHKKKASAA